MIVPVTALGGAATSITLSCTVDAECKFTVASVVAPSDTRSDPHVEHVVTTTARCLYVAAMLSAALVDEACMAVPR